MALGGAGFSDPVTQEFAEGLLTIAETGDATRALNALSTAIEGCSGIQLAFIQPDGAFVQSACQISDLSVQERLAREFSTPDKNPVIAAMPRLNQRRFTLIDEFVDMVPFRESEFYHEMLKPREPNRVAMLSLPGYYGAISFGLEQQPDADFAQVYQVDWMTRQIAQSFELRVKSSAPSYSAFLVDAGGMPVGVAASQVGRMSLGTLQVGGPGRRLRTVTPVIQPDFDDALAQAIAGNRSEVVAPGDTGACRIQLIPGPPIGPWRLAWVEVGHLQAARWTALSLMAVHDLTPREASVTLALLEGQDVAVIADRLGLSVRSVRTYLSSVFAKTQTTSQPQLVSKLLGALH